MSLSMIQKLYFLFQKQIQTFMNEKMSEANLRDNNKKVHLNCKIKLEWRGVEIAPSYFKPAT